MRGRRKQCKGDFPPKPERLVSCYMKMLSIIPTCSNRSKTQARQFQNSGNFLSLSLPFLSSTFMTAHQIQVLRASLVAQWLRICLPKQGMGLWALIREDPTCPGATKPVCHNYWACSLEPASHSCWAHVPQLLKPACLEPVLHNGRGHRNEKPAHCSEE